MDALIVASVVAPLLVAILLLPAGSRGLALRLAPWAPFPALVLALVAYEPVALELPWLLLGSQLGLDGTGRVFLLASTLVWFAAGGYARVWLASDARRHRFAGFFLLTQAGNLGVCLALDAASFYFFFALMSLAAYGLVVHDRSAAAWRAGRVYLVMTLGGEMLILSGLLLAAAAHPLAAACLILGFGVKTGLPLLHVSLPLAYAAAPIPAAAALAGPMIKAGVLGWLRFLPLGEAALPGAGGALVLAGAAAIVYGSAVGLCQRAPGALLAYSSISQMGYFAAGIGAGLMAPELWPLLAPALLLYAVHHALAKAALFLGLGVAQRRGATRWVLAGLALPALALAGAPFTSGMLAKLELKQALGALAEPWTELLLAVLAAGALGTALLMLRLLGLLRRGAAQRTGSVAGLAAPWSLLLAGVAGLTAWLAPASAWQSASTASATLAAGWPLLAALALAYAAGRAGLRAPGVPPGDVLVPFERLLAACGRLLPRLPGVATPPALPRPTARPARLETRLRAWPLAGLLWLVCVALLAMWMAR